MFLHTIAPIGSEKYTGDKCTKLIPNDTEIIVTIQKFNISISNELLIPFLKAYSCMP